MHDQRLVHCQCQCICDQFLIGPAFSKDKGKGRASEADTSGEICIRGKELELVAASEEHQRNERERERYSDVRQAEVERTRDKERIRVLEQEIIRLKEEVHSTFSIGYSVLTRLP
jgi:hypothetical protein